MLRMNGMRQPQVTKCGPEIALNARTARFDRNSPAGAPLRPGGDEAAMAGGARPLHRQEDRAAPFAADPDPLDRAQDRQDDRAPDADRGVTRHEGDEEGRDPHQQQGRDQRRLAPDAVAVMAEDRRPDGARDKAHRIDRERLQRAGQRVRTGKIELGEDEPGRRAVEKEIVPLDRGADRAGQDRAPQLPAVFEFR
jgi:hypothetical protein